MKKTYTIRLTREEALQQGLLTCECGHPINNHFDFSALDRKYKPCAHCKCKDYKEVARIGELI